MPTFYKGLVIGVPISLALWAIFLLPVAAEVERHPHALTHLETKVSQVISRTA